MKGERSQLQTYSCPATVMQMFPFDHINHVPVLFLKLDLFLNLEMYFLLN